MSSLRKIFDLHHNFTFDDLTRAYRRKITELDDNVNMSSIDKILLKNSYNKYYQKGLIKLQHNKQIIQLNHQDDFSSYFNDYFTTLKDMYDTIDNKINSFDGIKDIETPSIISSYHSHKSMIGKDGVETIYERNEDIKNGVKTKTKKAYKKYPDGKIEPIDIK